MATFMALTDIITTKLPMSPTQTLADVVIYLRDIGAGMVRVATLEEIESHEAPDEHHNKPVYKNIQVYLTKEDQQNNKPMYMVFVDNGGIHFWHGDVLEEFLLDDEEFFSEIPYNYDAIFEAFFLDGHADLASFAGFFIVPEV